MINRLRQKDNLSDDVINYEIWERPSGSGTCDLTKFSREATLLPRLPRVIGKKQVTMDEYPSKWDTRIPSFREFEVRSFDCGADDGKLTVALSYSQCPEKIVTQVYKGKLALLTGGMPQDISGALSVDPDAADKALQQAWSNVTQPDVDFGENIAQMADTLRMIQRPLAGAVKGLTNLAKRSSPSGKKVKKPKKVPKRRLSENANQFSDEITSRWLEARYGLLPLMLDTKAGMKMYAENFQIHYDVKVSHGSHYSPAVVVNTPYSVGSPNFMVNFDCGLKTESTYVTRACIYHQNVFGDSVNPNLYRLGLHPYQIPNLMWNIVPLGFVVDWVWDVSGFIAALSPIAGKQHFGNTVSFKSTNSTYRKISGVTCAYPYKGSTVSNVGAESHVRKYKRITNWPYPVKLLRGADLSSVHRAIDALALTVQNIPRLFRR